MTTIEKKKSYKFKTLKIRWTAKNLTITFKKIEYSVELFLLLKCFFLFFEEKQKLPQKIFIIKKIKIGIISKKLIEPLTNLKSYETFLIWWLSLKNEKSTGSGEWGDYLITGLELRWDSTNTIKNCYPEKNTTAAFLLTLFTNKILI